MFDGRYFAYATICAVLVISPGATMAVVLETAIEHGPTAAFATVAGVNIGNSTLGLASAFGMALLFARWPWALQAVRVAGACYLTFLGVRGLWRAMANTVVPGAQLRVPGGGSSVTARGSLGAFIRRGVATNLLNPPVVLFYMTLLPQFISRDDPFFARFLVLAATHVAMSLVWLSIYAISIGTLSERLARPAARRWMAGVTGAVLIGLGVRLVLQ
jgi:threonine/homoserine/homoserine lactone efflux protein